MKVAAFQARRLGGALALVGALAAAPAQAGHYPMYASWAQPDGPGSAIELSYSFSNLLDGGLRDASGTALPASLLRSAFEQALSDYAAVLPIHFVEVTDAGPLPETGEYDPAGLADIRVGLVANISHANAYAYFPFSAASGLAGDIVFNAGRFGAGWTPLWFYAVAQHELGHTLGMGHYESSDVPAAPPAQSSVYEGPVFALDGEMIVALQGVYGGGTGSVTPLSAVPEPEAWAMLLAGLGLVSALARRGARPVHYRECAHA
ncbi:PEP-CTERM sorting domain-containing protein [Methyloversatilis sp.]|uniref:PEP-CTERM sorting domain-containing protein n=1 Tax=Methyloversatilis sp. TaxID=2569862 RepID=UPI0027355858|nr:PEP-CTERM sorting domain-containing protein [Methyloversatilis sp.]MDP2867767.1 PEP-CTERM sorting domain-containing protein [Methyloversatilis sp.]MDP3287212.1 PEP-CTERM sorting domain-containing protein [Methyloversatilis sp.]MDP3455468.1 PEP-CTERM sorting domain-containing protein [Methyloversatilis sp.]MDP3577643.1 PEP-CTERM sorting domain-containing protein [Methyloversatilis sp.]